MTNNETSRLVDRADVERLIKQAHSNRVKYMRNHVRDVMWTAGSIGALCALALTGLFLSSTPRATTANHVSVSEITLLAN